MCILGEFSISFTVFVHVPKHIYYFLNKLEDSVNLKQSSNTLIFLKGDGEQGNKYKKMDIEGKLIIAIKIQVTPIFCPWDED